jgi:Zn-dependent membrane protease YugP
MTDSYQDPAAQRDLLLAAIASASGATTNIADALQDDQDLADLLFREDVVTDLACALGAALILAVRAEVDLTFSGRLSAMLKLLGHVDQFLVDEA